MLTAPIVLARKTYITSWLSGPSGLPPELQASADILRGPAGIDTRYRPLCTP